MDYWLDPESFNSMNNEYKKKFNQSDIDLIEFYQDVLDVGNQIYYYYNTNLC